MESGAAVPEPLLKNAVPEFEESLSLSSSALASEYILVK